MNQTMTRSARLRRAVGLSPWAIGGLGLLAAPRVVVHDLGFTDTLGYTILNIAPLAIWLVVVLWRRVPNPFWTLLAVGVAYGVVLAVGHQVLWTVALGEQTPTLGGNLEGVLPSAIDALVLRLLAVLSSLVTGTVVGAAVGAVAWVAGRLIPGLRPR